MTNRDPQSATEAELLRWSESLAAIARTGLAFTDNLYERERFEEVLAVAGDIRAAADRFADATAITSRGVRIEEWLAGVGDGIAGYVTPKAAVGAVVGDDDGRLLLVQRADSGVWLYPTGWADVGYSPAEVAVKEVREETGIDCEPLRLIAVFDGLRQGFSRVPLYSLVFHCRALGGQLEAHPLECTDVGFFARDELPTPVAGGEVWVEHAFAAIGGEPVEVLYDLPRTEPWLPPVAPDE